MDSVPNASRSVLGSNAARLARMRASLWGPSQQKWRLASPTLGEYTWKKYEKLVEHFKSCQLSFFYHQMKGPVTTTLSLLVSPNSYVFSAQQIFPRTFMSTCTCFKSHTILHFKNTIPLPDILNSNLSYSYNPNRNTFQIPTCALFWSMRQRSDLAATLEVLLNGVVVQDPPNPN